MLYVGRCSVTDRGKPKYRHKNLPHCYFMQDKFHVDSREIEQNA